MGKGGHGGQRRAWWAKEGMVGKGGHGGQRRAWWAEFVLYINPEFSVVMPAMKINEINILHHTMSNECHLPCNFQRTGEHLSQSVVGHMTK